MATPKNIITFDKNVRHFILGAFGKEIDSDGYIIEKASPEERVLTPEGEQLQANRLGAIKRGSLKFFKSDLPSLLTLSDQLE
jgi:hypothetical protein